MVTTRDWNILEHLCSEKDIAGFLEAVMEETGDIRALCGCFADVAKARAINRLAKETGIDRRTLCMLFDDDGDAEIPDVSPDAIAMVAKAFAVAVPV
jgi:probable addiction module antidote protein